VINESLQFEDHLDMQVPAMLTSGEPEERGFFFGGLYLIFNAFLIPLMLTLLVLSVIPIVNWVTIPLFFILWFIETVAWYAVGVSPI